MNELAQKIAQFIKANSINTKEFTMEQIINGYFKSQEKMYSEIEKDLLNTL